MNDYNVKEYRPTSGVEFEWVDAVGDNIKDIRARRFQCRRSKDSQISEKTWKHLVENCNPVWRGIYDCAISCQRVFDEPTSTLLPSPTTSFQEHGGSIPSSAEAQSPSDGLQHGNKKKKQPACPVVLHVGLYSFKDYSTSDVMFL
jgi:hypothetical protein